MSVQDQINNSIKALCTPGDRNLAEAVTYIDSNGDSHELAGVSITRGEVEKAELLGAEIEELKGTVLVTTDDVSNPQLNDRIETSDETWVVQGVKLRLPGGNILNITRKRFKKREY